MVLVSFFWEGGLLQRRGGVIIGCYDTIPYEKIRLMTQDVHILPSFLPLCPFWKMIFPYRPSNRNKPIIKSNTQAILCNLSRLNPVPFVPSRQEVL